MLEKVIQKKNLDLVLNLCYSIPLLFDALNSVVSTAWYDSTLKLYVPLFVGTMFCVISLICGVIMIKRIEFVESEKFECST